MAHTHTSSESMTPHTPWLTKPHWGMPALSMGKLSASAQMSAGPAPHPTRIWATGSSFNPNAAFWKWKKKHLNSPVTYQKKLIYPWRSTSLIKHWVTCFWPEFLTACLFGKRKGRQRLSCATITMYCNKHISTAERESERERKRESWHGVPWQQKYGNQLSLESEKGLRFSICQQRYFHWLNTQ